MNKLLFVSLMLFSACVDYTERENDLKKKYPQCKILPTSSLLKENGYDFMIEYTLTKTIYAIQYYPASTTSISNVRLIK